MLDAYMAVPFLHKPERVAVLARQGFLKKGWCGPPASLAELTLLPRLALRTRGCIMRLPADMKILPGAAA
jgi:hypothetical protein